VTSQKVVDTQPAPLYYFATGFQTRVVSPGHDGATPINLKF
jgi:hypothetical protein